MLKYYVSRAQQVSPDIRLVLKIFRFNKLDHIKKEISGKAESKIESLIIDILATKSCKQGFECGHHYFSNNFIFCLLNEFCMPQEYSLVFLNLLKME